MNEHERQTAFLRQCILYEETAERHALEERLAQAQRDERCVRRAVWFMALLTALAVVGICYSAVFLKDYPHDISQFIRPPMNRICCALGLGSLISLLVFACIAVAHRANLNCRREECRRLAEKLLESHIGSSTKTAPEIAKDPAEAVNGSEGVTSLADGGRERSN